jgi:PfaD family protein
MFEMGVKLQVLKRGTMFAMRAQKLYDLYRTHPNWQAIPEAERVQVEKNLFRAGYADIWQQTREFFTTRDPAQAERGDRDPKHQMALVFRWYLGLSSRWANAGEPSRRLDYQVWCGPAMGAFNEWAKGSALEQPQNRSVVTVALNLMYGAAVTLRQQQLRQHGQFLPASVFPTGPLPLEEVEKRLNG